MFKLKVHKIIQLHICQEPCHNDCNTRLNLPQFPMKSFNRFPFISITKPQADDSLNPLNRKWFLSAYHCYVLFFDKCISRKPSEPAPHALVLITYHLQTCWRTTTSAAAMLLSLISTGDDHWSLKPKPNLLMLSELKM